MSEIKSLGRYEIVKELGRGGMGIVLLGKDPKIDRLVTLKIIKHSELGSDHDEDELIQRFYIEAKAAGKLTHPNIATIYDVGEEESISFMAMEFVAGDNLADILKKSGKLPIKQAARLVKQAALGLAFAHENGTVHRDIKPGNILVPGGDKVKITDFGLARLPAAGSVTQTGHAVGSPLYMSPEQVQGQHVDGRSDMFSLGVMFYEMITGKRPFEGESLTSIIFNIIKYEPPPPTELDHDLPPDVDRIITKMMAKEVDDRYIDCSKVVADLERLEQGIAIGDGESDAARTTMFNRSDMTVKVDSASALAAGGKGPWVMITGGIFVVAALAFGAWFLLGSEGKQASPTIPAPIVKPAPVADKPTSGTKSGVNRATVKVALSVTSKPAGEVFIDGFSVGNSPIMGLDIDSG